MEIDAVTQDPSRKLVSRKDGPFRSHQLRNRTATLDVNGIHNVVSIDRIKFSKTTKEAMQATGVKRHDDVPLED